MRYRPNSIEDHVPKKFPLLARNKTSLVLVAFALVIGGVSAQASGLLDLSSGGYLICINPKTTVVTHPARSSCPKGFERLILGAKGPAGAAGSNATLTCSQGGTCAVGSTGPGDGIVFYVQTAATAALWRYLEAAPNTWSGGTADPLMVWCSNSTQFVHSLTAGATGTVNTLAAIGKGFYDTKLMLASCTYDAANMATSFNGGGKSDWLLPSQDELNQLYTQRTVVEGFPVLDPQVQAYCSSFEDVYDHASYQNFPTGLQSTNVKSNGGYVRPVRAF